MTPIDQAVRVRWLDGMPPGCLLVLSMINGHRKW
jgi:hypothetical protein